MLTIGAILPVGTVIHSMLTTTQFASQYGDNWVLSDGRSVSGSLYHSVTGVSTIPDMRGAFIRNKGGTYNPDGDLTIGSYSADKFKSHTHVQNAHNHTASNVIIGGVSFGSGGGSGSYGSSTVTTSDATVINQDTGGNETAPRAIHLNAFIRIN